MPLNFNKTQFNRENAAKTPYIASPTDGEKHATGDQITFVLKNADETQPITWAFGDGNTASGATATHAYSTPGIRTATVTATDLEGNPVELAISLDIGNKPTVEITAPTTTKWTINSAIRFGATAVGADTYTWSFGDGSTAEGATPEHTYTETDSTGVRTYSITVTATNDYGSTTSGSITLELADEVTASFTGITEGQYLPTGTEISVVAQQPTKPALAAATSYAWVFGDGGTATGTTVSHTYTAHGDYSVQLTVDNGHGHTDAATITIHVGDAPDTPQISAPGVGTYGISIAVAATDTQPISAWSIDWGDGTTPATTATANHAYARGTHPAVKTFEITVTATNVWGTAQETHHIEIADAIPAVITSPTDGDYISTGQTISLVAQLPTEIANLAVWRWYDGETLIGSTREASHAFATGDHTIALEVGNGHGGTTTDIIAIHVGEPPTITISAPGSGSKYTSGDEIEFTAAITAGGTVEWTFGDGNAGTGQNTTHTYTGISGVQTFTVAATVTNHWGEDSDTVELELAAPADATITDSSEEYIPLGTSISLAATQQTNADLEAATTYTWDLGDGSTKTGRTITHTYQATGTYSATVTVGNGHGQQETSAAKTIHIGNPPGTVTITIPGRATYGQTISMSATATGGTPDTWEWTFGDGGMATGQNTTHTYTAGTAGVVIYTVTTTASNNYGTTNASKQIQIAKPFDAAIVSPIVDSKNPLGTAIDYEADQPTDPDLAAHITYTFAAGDGFISDQPAFSHEPSTTGRFTATLSIDNGHGYADTTTVSYEVGIAPVVSIITPENNAHVTAGKIVEFAATATGATTVTWAFGDGGTATGQTTTHTYDHSTGNDATVTASATNEYGTATATITLQLDHARFRYTSPLGEELLFIDEYCVLWEGVDGLSGIPADGISTGNSDIIGEMYQKTTFGQRAFTLDIMVYGDGKTEVERNKDRLISVMMPFYGLGKVYHRKEDGSEWYCNCMVSNGYPRFVNGSYETAWPGEIGFVAFDPCWYSVDEVVLSGAGIITNPGNLPVGGVIVLGATGATNETTGESITATGTYDLSGIEVSTVDGAKYAKDADGNNVLYKIGISSQFISFAPGQNRITGAQKVTFRPRLGGL